MARALERAREPGGLAAVVLDGDLQLGRAHPARGDRRPRAGVEPGSPPC
jgi:hypothetical protein